MIVDSSALVEILLSAADGPRMLPVIIAAESRGRAAPNWRETALMFESRTAAKTVEQTGASLPFKFRDFSRTDITPALRA